jgi:hypothetical protein
LLAAATEIAAAPDARTLIEGLARDAPASIAFTEARFSRLLREPLMVSGELGYLGTRSLERRVTTPYRETTEIRADSVHVEREGEKARSFALKRAPELEGFLEAFTALLAGDFAALEKTFTIVADGNDGGWSLELTPLDEQARDRLRAIVIHGSGAEPRCLATLGRDGGSMILLGVEAERPITPETSFDDLLARCGAR